MYGSFFVSVLRWDLIDRFLSRQKNQSRDPSYLESERKFDERVSFKTTLYAHSTIFATTIFNTVKSWSWRQIRRWKSYSGHNAIFPLPS